MNKHFAHRRILFLVQLPPPIHGVSIINKMVWENDDLFSGWDKELIKLKFSRSTKQLRKFSMLKLFRFFWIFFQLLWKCTFHRIKYVYFTIVPTCPGFYRDLFFVILIKTFHITPIYHLHLMGIRKNSQKKILRILYQWTFSNAILIHLSENVYKSEFSNLRTDNHKVFIQPNGLPDMFQPGIKKNNQQLHILHISHLYRFKGLHLLLEAFHNLIENGYDLHLDIIGDRADRDVELKLHEYSGQSEMNDRITWHGMRTDRSKHELIGKSDIMVLPTMVDTFPLTILEGMQHELPVIATHKGAIPEMLEDQKSGVLIEAGNHQQLKDSLESLIKNREMREEIGKDARKKYLNHYTDNHFYNGMKKIFDFLD